MLRAVLDVNVLVSALIRPEGPSGRIVARLVEGAFRLVSSPAIMAEARRALGYPRVRRYLRAPVEPEAWLEALEFLADMVDDPTQVPSVCIDPDDDKYLGVALVGRATLVVSGDRHLLDVGENEGVRIIPPAAFLQLLGPG